MSRLSLFFEALDNEIAIDSNVVERMAGQKASYVPIRPLKTMKWFEFGASRKPTYLCLCLLFFLAYFPYVIVTVLKYFKKRRTICSPATPLTLLLNSNGKSATSFSKICGESRYISFEFLKGEKFHSELSARPSDYLRVSDVFAVIYDSFAIIPKFFASDYSFLDFIQLYISVDWFASYRALQRFLLENDVEDVFFSNHYDRWAVLFDNVFDSQTLNLMQHGVFPEKGFVPHKLKNIDNFFLLSESERHKLSNFTVEGGGFNCHLINNELDFYDPKVSGPTILVIGQPQSANEERILIELLSSAASEIHVFLKPHPVYGAQIYKAVTGLVELTDSKSFPKVDLAICFESTLGLEYEGAGIPVIWWGNRSPKDLVEVIKQSLRGF